MSGVAGTPSQAEAPASGGAIPVYFIHEEDFEWWLGMLDPHDSIRDAAVQLGRFAIGTRVPERDAPLGILMIEDTGHEGGILLDPLARVIDAIPPLSLLKLVWLPKDPVS